MDRYCIINRLMPILYRVFLVVVALFVAFTQNALAMSQPTIPHVEGCNLTECSSITVVVHDPTPEFSAISNYNTMGFENVNYMQVVVATDNNNFDTTIVWNSGNLLITPALGNGVRCRDVNYGEIGIGGLKTADLVSNTYYYWRIQFYSDCGSDGSPLNSDWKYGHFKTGPNLGTHYIWFKPAGVNVEYPGTFPFSSKDNFCKGLDNLNAIIQHVANDNNTDTMGGGETNRWNLVANQAKIVIVLDCGTYYFIFYSKVNTYQQQLFIDGRFITNSTYYITIDNSDLSRPVIAPGASTHGVVINAPYTRVNRLSATGSTNAGYAGYFISGDNSDYVTLDNCFAYNNYYGICVASTTSGFYPDYDNIFNCLSFNNLQSGIFVYGQARYTNVERCEAFDNQATKTQSYGIYASAYAILFSLACNLENCTIKNNNVHDNNYAGIYIGGYSSLPTAWAKNCKIIGNRIYANTTLGLYDSGLTASTIDNSLLVKNNIIYSNGTNQNTGIWCGSSYANYINNTIYNHDNCGVKFSSAAGFNQFNSNIICVQNSATSYGIYCETTSALTYSNYNDIYRLGANGYVGYWNSANRQLLNDWQSASANDLNSISQDPLFYNAGGYDFHLKSPYGHWDESLSNWTLDSELSPCVDAGDPNADYSLEPVPNHGRINQGAYGGTMYASKSSAPAQPTGPWCEGQTNPADINNPTPAFSAVFQHPLGGVLGTHYEIEVNNASDFSGQYYWQSGKTAFAAGDEVTAGGRCADIVYAGYGLARSKTYYWHIKFYDQWGAQSQWSETQQFSTSAAPGLSNAAGISIEGGGNNLIRDNKIYGGKKGIELKDTSGNIVYGTRIAGTTEAGISLQNASNNAFIQTESFGHLGNNVTMDESGRNKFIDSGLGYSRTGTFQPDTGTTFTMQFGNNVALMYGCFMNASALDFAQFHYLSNALLSRYHNRQAGEIRLLGDYEIGSGDSLNANYADKLYNSSASSPITLRGASLIGSVQTFSSTATELWTAKYNGSDWTVTGTTSGEQVGHATGGAEYTSDGNEVRFTITESSPRSGDMIAFWTSGSSQDAGIKKYVRFGPSAYSLRGGASRLTVLPGGTLSAVGGGANQYTEFTSADGARYLVLIKGGAANMNYFLCYYLADEGIRIESNANVAINNGIFDFGMNTSDARYISAFFTGNMTLSNLVFENTNGFHGYNVYRPIEYGGLLTLGNFSGTYGGSPYAYNPSGTVNWASASGLNAPIGLVMLGCTSNSITYGWTNMATYHLGFEIHDDTYGYMVTAVGKNQTSVAEYGLGENVEYKRHIHATRGWTRGPASSVLTASTQLDAPLSTELSANPWTEGQLTLTVAAPPNYSSGMTGSQFICTSAGGYGASNSGWLTGIYSFTDSGLEPNCMFTYNVRYRNRSGLETTYSSGKSFYSPAAVPQNFSFGICNSTTISLQWDNGENPAGTKYQIQYKSMTSPVFSDNFDDGDLNGWTLTSSGGGNWAVNSSVSHSPSFCASSGLTANFGCCSILRTVVVPTDGTTLSFWWKVSSESGWDYLECWDNGTRLNRISGTVDWTVQSYALTAGPHVIKWTYVKDSNDAAGNDTGYIDDVVVGSSPNYYELANTTNLAYAHTGLFSEGTYYYRARAFNGNDVYTAYSPEIYIWISDCNNYYVGPVGCPYPTLASAEAAVTNKDLSSMHRQVTFLCCGSWTESWSQSAFWKQDANYHLVVRGKPGTLPVITTTGSFANTIQLNSRYTSLKNVKLVGPLTTSVGLGALILNASNVLIDACELTFGNAALLNTTTWGTVEGLRVTNCVIHEGCASQINLANIRDAVFENSTVYGAQNSFVITNALSVTVQECILNSSKSSSVIFMLSNSTDVALVDSLCNGTNNAAECVRFSNSRDVTIDNCVLSNYKNYGVYADNSADFTISSNIINPMVFGTLSGITMTGQYSGNASVYNNMIFFTGNFDAFKGIEVLYLGNHSWLDIYSNTISITKGGSCVYLGGTGALKGKINIKNNILRVSEPMSNYFCIETNGPAGIDLTSDYNFFNAAGTYGKIGKFDNAQYVQLINWQDNTSFDHNSLADLAEPKFISAGNLHLAENSMCIKTGLNLGSPYASDIDGEPRSSSGAWCFGADERSGSVLPLRPNPCYLGGKINPSNVQNPDLRFSATYRNLNPLENAVMFDIKLGDAPCLSNIWMYLLGIGQLQPDANCSEITYSGPSLNAFKNYYWQLRFKSYSGNWGAWSEVQQFTTGGLYPPNAPVNPLCDGITNNLNVQTNTPAFSAQFSDPDTGDKGKYWDIQVGSASGVYDMWCSSGAFETPVDIGAYCAGITYAGATIASNTTYYWRLKFGDLGSNYGPYCAEQYFKTSYINPPNAPNPVYCEDSINPSSVTDATPEFKGRFTDPDAPSMGKYYRIQVGATPGASDMWDSGKTLLTPLVNQDANSTDISYAGASLSEFTTYYWRIKFYDDFGIGGAWCPDNYFVMGQLYAGYALNPDPANESQEIPVNYKLGWSNVPDADSYMVYMGCSTNFTPGDAKGSVFTNSFDMWSNINYFTTYYWRIDCVKNGNTRPGALWCFRTSSDWWENMSMTNAPSVRRGHSSVWTGAGLIIWGGFGGSYLNDGRVYYPENGSWINVNPTGAPAARAYHTAIWTGKEMIIFGGSTDTKKYNPISKAWSSVSTTNAPSSRLEHTAVWTGSKMIVWGGENGSYLNDGKIYDPEKDIWSNISSTNAPYARMSHSAVWTGSRMIIWGGWNGSGIADGKSYDPVQDIWTDVSMTNAPSPRYSHSVAWTGSKMIIWGGGINTGKSYDPQSDTWTNISDTGAPFTRTEQTSVWTGSNMIIWGGKFGTIYFDNGRSYDAFSDSWKAMSSYRAPCERSLHSANWTGGQMLAWGGWDSVNNFDNGCMYNKVFDPLDNWNDIYYLNAPQPRYGHTAVWTGSKMIVWGGTNDSNELNTGGVYNPASDSWQGMNSSAPLPRKGHTAVWTGSKMLVWGGISGSYIFYNGGIYTLDNNSWSSNDLAGGSPPSRYNHTAVWTGKYMIVYGGQGGSMTRSDGGIYCLENNWWTTSMASSAPRENHTAVWTGSKMLVFGGDCGGTIITDKDNMGMIYDFAGNSWMSMNAPQLVAGRINHSAVWTGRYMLVFGGIDNTGAPLNDCWVFDLENRLAFMPCWATIPASGVEARSSHVAFWTGSQMVVWGGEGSANYLSTGAVYDWRTRTWRQIGLSGKYPSKRKNATAVWTGCRAIIWGGYDGNPLDTGSTYQP